MIHQNLETGREGGSASGPDDGLPRWFLELNVAGFEPDLKVLQ